MSKRIARRSFLRGAAGVAIGLPFLRIMAPERALADGPTGAIPKKFLVAFASGSIGIGNDYFVPTATGAGYPLTEALSALGPGERAAGFYDVRDAISIVSGLKLPWTAPGSVPTEPGTRSIRFHQAQQGPLFSGTSSATDRTYVDGSGQVQLAVNLPSGESADQKAGRVIGADRPHRALAYRVQAYYGEGTGTGGNRSLMSYRRNGDRVEEVAPTFSPRQAYNALIGSTASPGPDPAEVARRDFLFRRRLSVLDLAADDVSRLSANVGVEDRHRLDRHFTEIRDLEQRISSLSDFEAGELCPTLDDPGPDPEFRGGYANEEERARTFVDLIHLAFACDLSRSASLMFSWEQSRLNMREPTGFDGSIHDLGHNPGSTVPGRDYGDKVAHVLAAIHRWHIKHFARLVRKLEDTPDGIGGTLLDHSAMVLHFEGGRGYDPQDDKPASNHSTENMVAVVAGRAGGLKAGHHIVARDVHPTLVTTSALAAVGAGDELGEVRGRIPAMFV